MEGQRCAKLRLTGYNFAGESILSIWRGVNSYAMVAPVAGAVTFEAGNFDVAVGDTAVTSGDAIAPGTIVTVSGGSGYDLTEVKVNGVSVAISEDKASFAMPQENAVVTVTTTAE